MRRCHLKPFLLLIGTGCQFAAAQPATHNPGAHPWSVAVYYDQDYTLEQLGLKSLNEDRNYTMGLGILISNRRLKRNFLYAPHLLLNRLTGHANLNDKNDQDDHVVYSLMLANGTFTPDSLASYNVITDDRPYGSITYLQTITARTDLRRFAQYTTTLSVGILGSGVSRVVQTKIHESMNDHDTHNPRTPRGWPHQISNGGEPTLSFTAEEERLLSTKAVRLEEKTSVGGIEIKHSWKYSLGYYTDASYALNFRLGKKDPRNWTYRVNPNGQHNNLAFAPRASNVFDDQLKQQAAYYNRPNSFEVYVFGSARPTLMLYNALINGQLRHSDQTISFTEMKHLIFEFDGGGAVSVPICPDDLLEIKLRISGRSPEFKLGDRPERWHFWGGVDLAFSHR